MNAFLERLTHFLSDQIGSPVTLRAVVPVPGGASLETLAVNAAWDGRSHDLIVRRDAESRMYAGALSRAEEFALLRVAFAHGVRVARPLFLDVDDPRPYFVVERREGTSIGAKVVRDPALASARQKLMPQLAAELARIHAMPRDDLEFLPRPAEGRTGAAELLVMLQSAYRELDRANAVWAFGLRWLERHLPAPAPLTVVHGDFRVGNFLVSEQGLTAVLDWEFAHVGDPAEDLAWIAVRDWRFGNDRMPVGGVGARDAFLSAYRAAGGATVDAARLRWWEIAGNLKWAIFALAQAHRHLSGKEPNIEYAALGRRSAEMEWEMLRLIEAENEWGA